MNTINRFILKSYLPPFALTFVISMFVLFMQFIWKWVDELVGKGLEWGLLTELFFYASLATVPLALPLSVLLSSLMTFGNLAENYELAALKSSGHSLLKIMRPLLIFICFVTIGAFLFSNYLLPYAQLKMLSALFDIQHQKPALNIREGVFYNDIEGYSIRIRKIGADQKTLEDIMVYDHTNQNGNTSLTVAEKGKMYMTDDKHFLVLELKNGKTYNDITNTREAFLSKPFMRMTFKEQLVRLDLSSFKMTRTPQDLFSGNHQMLNGDQLQAYIDTMRIEINKDRTQFHSIINTAYLSKSNAYWKLIDSLKISTIPANLVDSLRPEEQKKAYELAINNARNVMSMAESKVTEINAEEEGVRRFQIEFWRKYTFSFACLIMFFIGAPLGAIIRKGGLGMPVVISVVFFIVFWVISITGEKLSKDGAVPPEYGMWLGCLIYLPIGIWLTKKATADSSLFDIDSYKNILRKLNVLRYKREQKLITRQFGDHQNTGQK